MRRFSILSVVVCSCALYPFVVAPSEARELLFASDQEPPAHASQPKPTTCDTLRAAKTEVYGFRPTQLNESQIDAKGKDDPVEPRNVLRVAAVVEEPVLHAATRESRSNSMAKPEPDKAAFFERKLLRILCVEIRAARNARTRFEMGLIAGEALKTA